MSIWSLLQELTLYAFPKYSVSSVKVRCNNNKPCPSVPSVMASAGQKIVRVIRDSPLQ